MGRLDDYRSALLVADPAVSDAALEQVLEGAGPDFDLFVIDHGLGPSWHERTGHAEFRDSRLTAEALYLAQESALRDIDAALNAQGIAYVLIKGGATRLALYDNPALRACHDLDLLVCPDDRVRAASVLVDTGFRASPESKSISRELVLSRGDVDIDLHWGLLREGRLRFEDVPAMLARRERSHGTWMLSAGDALFLLLVHPAFTKHLGGFDMGLHRVADIVAFLHRTEVDMMDVTVSLVANGVATAGWTTLRWVQMLTAPQPVPGLESLLSTLAPGRLRRAWLNGWLERDLSARMATAHWVRLFGFTPLLHDAPGDVLRAFSGRIRARRRSAADMAAFRDLAG